MLFNSSKFIFVFLPFAVLLHFALARWSITAAVAATALTSLLFYAWWSPPFVLLPILSIAANFLIAQGMRSRGDDAARRLLVFGIVANLAVLGWFKYGDFLLSIFEGREPHAPEVPLALSFTTFVQIAFLIDVWRRRGSVHFPTYAMYVAFFPHLIAGRIVRWEELGPQRYFSSACGAGLARIDGSGRITRRRLGRRCGDLFVPACPRPGSVFRSSPQRPKRRRSSCWSRPGPILRRISIWSRASPRFAAITASHSPWATTPMRGDAMTLYDRADLHDVVERLSRVVSVWDFTAPDWLAWKADYWDDSSHFKPAVGAMMLERMFAPSPAPPSDFGVLRDASRVAVSSLQ